MSKADVKWSGASVDQFHHLPSHLKERAAALVEQLQNNTRIGGYINTRTLENGQEVPVFLFQGLLIGVRYSVVAGWVSKHTTIYIEDIRPS